MLEVAEAAAAAGWYARQGWWRHVQQVCADGLSSTSRSTSPDSLSLSLFRSFAVARDGAPAEALRDLSSSRNNNNNNNSHNHPAALVAMLAAHKLCRIVDEEAVGVIESRIEDVMRDVSHNSCEDVCLAGVFWFHSGDKRRARECAERVLRVQLAHAGAKSLLGWVEYSEGSVDKALALFTLAGKGCVDAVFGRAACLEAKEQYGPALSELASVSASGLFVVTQQERMRVLMAAGDWDQALESASRVLALDGKNIDALRLTALYLLAREGKANAGAQKAQDLLFALDAKEPRNARLYIQVARELSAVAGRNNITVLKPLLEMCERARKLSPEDASIAVAHGKVLLLTGGVDHTHVSAAREAFRTGCRLDEVNVHALHGVIRCQILDGQLEDAAQQVEFLGEVASSVNDPGSNAELKFLSAMLAWHQSGNATTTTRLLDQALEVHIQALRGRPFSYSFYAELDPPFMLQVAQLFLAQCAGVPPPPPTSTTTPNNNNNNKDSLSNGADAHPALERATRVLTITIQHVPGLLEAAVLLARAKHLAGDADGARRAAGAALRLDSGCAEAHLVLAQAAVAEGRAERAATALEAAVASNFGVREWPAYVLVQAETLAIRNRHEEALKVLEAAMNLAGVRRVGAGIKGSKPSASSKATLSSSLSTLSSNSSSVSQPERCSLFLALSDTLLHLNRIPEATKTVQDALTEFKGTSEEARVVLANARVMLARGGGGDVDAALSVLRNVGAGSSYYAAARAAMAEAHLNHRHDRVGYIACYQDIVTQTPGDPSAHVRLGEALMRVQEPERAVAALEAALTIVSKNSSNNNAAAAALASRIGKALVATHDYARAVDYYQSALAQQQGRESLPLQLELAELHLKLRQYDKAERVLRAALDVCKEVDSVSTTEHAVRATLLLARVHRAVGNSHDAALAAQQQAKTLQAGLLAHLRAEADADTLRVQRDVAADICFALAQERESRREHDLAVAAYNEALTHCETHTKALLALAKLHLSRGDTEACQAQCAALLRVEPTNEEASLMLADLMFRREQYDSAIYHLQQLLERKANHYAALAQLLQLLRRAGRLGECGHYLKAAQRASSGSVVLGTGADAGLHYCLGLHARHCRKLRDALRELNLARKDPVWGREAAYAMVEIYVHDHADNEGLWGAADQTSEDNNNNNNNSNSNGPQQPLDTREAGAAATKLLQEVRLAQGGDEARASVRHRVLECYALMASKAKGDVETALARLLEMAPSSLQDGAAASARVTLAVAVALLLQKQAPKARNQLKHVAKMAHNPEEAAEFERAWLLLADMYVQGGKHDVAKELCRRCLKYNKSCAKAWEHLAHILEREQMNKDAAEHYEHAWKFENEASAPVGFKLAYNYLKSRRYVEAINVCHKVLAVHPGYPKIHKEILDKARLCLRP
eukprot:jgi/Chlat1/2625/Chrsp178S02467